MFIKTDQHRAPTPFLGKYGWERFNIYWTEKCKRQRFSTRGRHEGRAAIDLIRLTNAIKALNGFQSRKKIGILIFSIRSFLHSPKKIPYSKTVFPLRINYINLVLGGQKLSKWKNVCYSRSFTGCSTTFYYLYPIVCFKRFYKIARIRTV